MREMYIILGWVGWIWLAIVMVVLPLALWIQHLRRRRQFDQQHQGASGVEVNGKNEKQS
jgi:heme exporter protein D